MLNMFPMQGMGSQGLGVAGGGGLDPRILAMLGASLGGGGGAPGGGMSPLTPGGATPMSQFIGARPPVGPGGVAPVVGGGMGGPPMGGGAPAPVGAPGALPAPGAGGQMDIASMLKTPQGLQLLLNTLKGNQEGLRPNMGPMAGAQQPTGGLPPQGATPQGASMDPMAFLRQLLGSGGGVSAGIPSGQGYT